MNKLRAFKLLSGQKPTPIRLIREEELRFVAYAEQHPKFAGMLYALLNKERNLIVMATGREKYMKQGAQKSALKMPTRALSDYTDYVELFEEYKFYQLVADLPSIQFEPLLVEFF